MFSASDADEQSLNAIYQWIHQDTQQVLGNSSQLQLSSSLIQSGQNLICSLSLDDGFDTIAQDVVVTIQTESSASFTSGGTTPKSSPITMA